MKKYVIVLLTLFMAACSDTNSESSTGTSARERNLEAIDEINKAIKSGDVSKLDQYIAADAVDHASPFGDVKGLDSIRIMLGKIHTMGTNMNMESIRRIADDEYVFDWMRLTGTTATADWGMPIGTNYDINAVQVSRFRDGKVIEHWEFMQPADMARMLEPGAPPAVIKDTLQNTDTISR